jgi:hypothetical protein
MGKKGLDLGMNVKGAVGVCGIMDKEKQVSKNGKSKDARWADEQSGSGVRATLLHPASPGQAHVRDWLFALWGPARLCTR